MNLYESIRSYIYVPYLINDLFLEFGNYITWDQLVANNRLTDLAAAELSAVIAYWQGKIDAEDNRVEKELIKMRVRHNLQIAFNGADRRQITEDQFKEILGFVQ